MSIGFKQPSASNAEAFVMCGASHVLPQSDTTGDWMARGNEGHEALAAKINGRPPKDGTARGEELISKFPLETVLKGVDKSTIDAEMAFAVNVKTKTVRILGRDIGRAYGDLQDFEIPTTLDVVGMKDGQPWIRDWKFGKSSSWWQLLVQAMAVAYGASADDEPADYVDAGFVMIEGETGGRVYHEDARIITLDEIDGAAEKLLESWGRVARMATDLKNRGQIPPTTSGAWCTFCGAYPYCPNKWQMAKALLGEVSTMGPDMIAALDRTQMGVLWAKINEAKRMLETAQEAVKGAALREEQGIPLPNGKRLVMVEAQGRKSIDADLAAQTIRRLGGTQEDVDKIMKRGRPYTVAKEMK
jgi:hypothetical protein